MVSTAEPTPDPASAASGPVGERNGSVPRIWSLLLGRWLDRRLGYLADLAELIGGCGLSRNA